MLQNINTETTDTTTFPPMVTSLDTENLYIMGATDCETNDTNVTLENGELPQELCEFLIEHGFLAEQGEVTLNDSGFYRFPDAEDKEGQNAGWCVPCFDDDEGNDVIIKAICGTHRDEGNLKFWESGIFSNLSEEEKVEINKRLAENKKLAQEELLTRQLEARTELKRHLDSFAEATSHPYLETKGIGAHGILRRNNNELVIPLSNVHGELITAQRILQDGTKLLSSGCGKKGAFYKIDGDGSVILISEGFATAASLHEATGYTSVMAIDAGNMFSVAEAIQEKYKDYAIVICADNDQFKERNTGIEKATLIREHLDIPFVYPEFQDVTEKPTDFNDLAQLEGNEVVETQLKSIVEEAALRIPKGFSIRPDGIYHTVIGRDGNEYEKWLSSTLKVIAQTRNEGNESWGRYVELVDNDRVVHKFALPMTMFTGQSDYLTPLVDRGFIFDHCCKSALTLYLLRCNPVNRTRCVTKTGWSHNVYVLPESVIGKTNEHFIYQSPSISLTGFEERGTVEEWRDNVGSLCVNNSRLLFGVSVAFATILLDMLDAESGGFHFRCGSSRGKTTILQLAKSVWGSPKNLPRWRATTNGLEGLATNHNHSLLCLDEFSQLSEVNPKQAGEAIYMLGNGEGKQRSRRDGTSANRQTWQLLYLSAGEVSLQATMEQANMPVRAGQEVRFIDLPADAGADLGVFDTIHDYVDGNHFAMAIKENVHEYYGTASRAFIECVTENREEVKENLLIKIKAFMDDLNIIEADPQVQRVAYRFAIVASAGEIASELGITGWDSGQAEWASLECFEEWMDNRGGSDSHEETQAIDTVKGRILENDMARFMAFDRPQQNGAIWGLTETNGYFVLTKAFKENLCEGLDYKYVAKLLFEKGMLSTSGSRLTKTKRINGRNVRCYHILPTLFDEELNEEEPSEVEVVEDSDPIDSVYSV